MKVQIEISTPFAVACVAVALIALAGAHVFGFVTLPVDTAAGRVSEVVTAFSQITQH